MPGTAWQLLSSRDEGVLVLFRGQLLNGDQACPRCWAPQVVTTWRGPAPWAPDEGAFDLEIQWCALHGLLDSELRPDPPWPQLEARDTRPIRFRGWLLAYGQPCEVCATPDTVEVWHGPAPYGLVPDPTVGQEVRWCRLHGELQRRLRDSDGNEYAAAL